MLRSCGCFRRKRRCSSFEDSSSCRSSELERGGEPLTPTENNIMKLFTGNGGWCRPWRKTGRGMSMTKIERTMKAAILIQRWYRRYLARMEVRRRYTWTIFQSLEYAGEHDQVRLYNFFNALLTHIPDTVSKQTDSCNTSRSSSTEAIDAKFSDESDDLAEEGITGPERPQYRGPHINFPMTKKDLDTLIDLFRKKKYNRLHPKYVAGILLEAKSKLKRLPNLNQASTAISKQVTICGDLHGKLDDLLVVFHKNGLPSPENPYVFNGDFVDRGKKSLEVLLLLLSCLLVFPGGVFLNRGNHEDSVMNARYGFIREVHQKYKHNAERLLKLIDGVYRWLPLGTIVNNRVLVVHGGISDSTDLDLIRSLDRGKYVSLLRPPILENAVPGAEVIDKVEWKQVFDILWSDPQHTEGCKPNSLRGAGSYFGPDVTRRFTQRYKLMYVVRSHECKPEGYEMIHDGKVITIFSASNYYEIGSNKGAYMKLDPQLDIHFVQYTAAASKTRKLTFRQRVGLVESSAIRELAAQLRDRRDELEQEFLDRDTDRTGTLTLAKWCEAMEAATSLGLPWRLLRERLAPPDPDYVATCVHYNKTLDLLDSDMMKSHPGTSSVAESLYRNKSSLEAIFRILDKDNSGQISLEEFAEACHLLHKHLPEHGTEEDLLEMCKMMDINKDGLVDLNEFLEAFRLCDQARRGARGRALIIGESLSLEKSAPTTSTSPMLASNVDLMLNGGSGGLLKPVASNGSVAGGGTGEPMSKPMNGVVVTTSEVDPQDILKSQGEDEDEEDESEGNEDDEEDASKDKGSAAVVGKKNGLVVETNLKDLKIETKIEKNGGNTKTNAEDEDDGESVCLTKKKNGSCSKLEDRVAV